MMLYSILWAALFGLVLGIFGIFANSIEFWVLLVMFSVNQVIGYHRGKTESE